MRYRQTLASVVVLCLAILSAAYMDPFPASPTQADAPIIGRWDLTVNMGYKVAPSWLEVKLSGVKTLVGYFVADGGSARPISQVSWKEGKLSFSIPPQWDRTDQQMVFDGTLTNGRLSGTILSSKGEKHTFTGAGPFAPAGEAACLG